MDILDFAKDNNADEVYAKIREVDTFTIVEDKLVLAADRYEEGILDDNEFCEKVIEILK